MADAHLCNPYGDPAPHSVRALVTKACSGQLLLSEIAADCRARIKKSEAEIQAWQALDWNAVESQIDTLNERGAPDQGALFGVPIGIKDIYDTFDFPTTYGSEIYAENRPVADAAVVARLRAAGAIITGKTMSTEFAYWKPAKTRNPLDLTRSPGGSSAGSAAAVAAGMVPLALGSQTAASTIRPAAYCGIVGFKPTHGWCSLAGVKALANSLDTVGMFARSVADIGMVAAIVTGDHALGATFDALPHPRFAILTSPEWSQVSAPALAAVTAAGARAKAAGASVRAGAVPAAFADFAEVQTLVMAYEAARELAHERRVHFHRLSQPLRELLIDGEGISHDAYCAARRRTLDGLATIDDLFAGADFLLAPSTLDEAPKFEDGTGDPAMCRAWTILGLPSISIPCGLGDNGLPLGLQIAARPNADAALLAAATWFELCLNSSASRGFMNSPG